MLRSIFILFVTLISLAGYSQNIEKTFDNKDEELREVAKDLRCPTCQGISVLESDADFSRQIKNIVSDKIKSGESKQEILKYFSDRYGPWILREPPKKGFNALAWYVPLSFLIFAPIVIYFFVVRKAPVATVYNVRSTEEIVEEMKKELSLLKEGGQDV